MAKVCPTCQSTNAEDAISCQACSMSLSEVRPMMVPHTPPTKERPIYTPFKGAQFTARDQELRLMQELGQLDISDEDAENTTEEHLKSVEESASALGID